MKLARTIPCTLFEIGSPRWNGNAQRREVGLNIARVTKHNEIHFTYQRKSDGKLSLTDNYYFDGDKLIQLDYQHQTIKGVTLALIPLSDLEILERI